MVDATAAALEAEIDAALQRAAKSRDELQRRAAAASERTRRRQTLARAEALAPHFRAEILRRARELQRTRVQMLGTLRTLSTKASAGTDAVLSALDGFVRAEDSTAWWPLTLPAASRWRAVRRAARDGDGDTGEMEAALANALAPAEVEENEEEEEGKGEKEAPRMRIACVCSMAEFGRGAEVVAGSNSPSESGSGAWGRREEKKEKERRATRADEESDSETGNGSGNDGELVREVLQAAAAHIDALDAAAEKEEEEEEEAESDAFESAMEEARLRLSLELAARAVACRHAVESLVVGEDRNLFDGIAMVGASPALALPAMEQLFYCAAYAVGAAIARDEANERRGRVGMDMEDEERPNDAVTEDNQDEPRGTVGWRGVMGRWVTAGMPMASRLLRYLLEFVIHPREEGRSGGVCVAPVVVRAWLTEAMREEKDGEAQAEALMHVFLSGGGATN